MSSASVNAPQRVGRPQGSHASSSGSERGESFLAALAVTSGEFGADRTAEALRVLMLGASPAAALEVAGRTGGAVTEVVEEVEEEEVHVVGGGHVDHVGGPNPNLNGVSAHGAPAGAGAAALPVSVAKKRPLIVPVGGSSSAALGRSSMGMSSSSSSSSGGVSSGAAEGSELAKQRAAKRPKVGVGLVSIQQQQQQQQQQQYQHQQLQQLHPKRASGLAPSSALKSSGGAGVAVSAADANSQDFASTVSRQQQSAASRLAAMKARNSRRR